MSLSLCSSINSIQQVILVRCGKCFQLIKFRVDGELTLSQILYSIGVANIVQRG
jgi:hypothetical protein